VYEIQTETTVDRMEADRLSDDVEKRRETGVIIFNPDDRADINIASTGGVTFTEIVSIKRTARENIIERRRRLRRA